MNTNTEKRRQKQRSYKWCFPSVLVFMRSFFLLVNNEVILRMDSLEIEKDTDSDAIEWTTSAIYRLRPRRSPLFILTTVSWKLEADVWILLCHQRMTISPIILTAVTNYLKRAPRVQSKAVTWCCLPCIACFTRRSRGEQRKRTTLMVAEKKLILCFCYLLHPILDNRHVIH